ncbi:hypothetical protein VC87395_000615 [Vibrio paracholerae 87395]|nr:hypothetical protein OSU_2800 [Vibrio cholerae PS15]EMP93966.1 hypothetical protein VC87395_000615 [Vibrio paracholerae 87395]
MLIERNFIWSTKWFNWRKYRLSQLAAWFYFGNDQTLFDMYVKQV